MKTFPKLYARTSTGAIQEWQIFVEDDSFYCVYGQVDGKKIVGAKTLCTMKNEGRSNQTVPQEQAEKEAAAEYKKKIEQGGYFESIDEIDKETVFFPQLAKGWEDYRADINLAEGNWCISPKLDGCLDGNSLIKIKWVGYKTIREVVENRIIGKVLSYNVFKKRNEYKDIIGFAKNGVDTDNTKWFQIELENGNIMNLTGNHLVYLPKLQCWRRVDALKGDEDLLLEDNPSTLRVKGVDESRANNHQTREEDIRV